MAFGDLMVKVPQPSFKSTTKTTAFKTPKVKSSPDPFQRTVTMQDKRTAGLTRGLLKPYQSQPSRFIPKEKGFQLGSSLKALAAAGKVKEPVI